MDDARNPVRSAERQMSETLPASGKQFRKASEVLPGGASRSRFWWPTPLYVERACGVTLHDIDGRTYVDCLMGFGSMILGHLHPVVVDAIKEQLENGVVFGAPCVQEEELASILVSTVPGAERVVFVSSGTEATMTALRLARAATGRDAVAKFEGGWHGAQDFLLHNFSSVEGTPAAPVVVPQSAGISRTASRDVVPLPFNHEAALERIRQEAERLACVIVEPVQGAAGGLPTEPEFLRELRAICDELDIILIFDEVITGFRLGPSGAAGRFGVTPDLVTIGKIIGGGLAIGAVAGRRHLVERVFTNTDQQPVAASGTFAANPLAMASGVAQLTTLLGRPDTYPRLEALGQRMRDGLVETLRELEIEAWVTGLGALWGLHFSSKRPRSVRDLADSPRVVSELLAAYLLLEGVVMSAPVHLGFLSTAHRDEDVDLAISAHRNALGRLKEEGYV